MHPTKWPSLASVWGSRRALGQHDHKDPLNMLQTLNALKSLKSLQALKLPQRLRTLQSLRELHEMQGMQPAPLNWPHVSSHDFLFYSSKGQEPIIRLDKSLVRVPSVGTIPPFWLRLPPTPPSHYVGGGKVEQPRGAEGPWGGLVHGVVAGAVLLVAAMLLVRFVDRLSRRIIGLRRRPSEEWPTPTVLATSQQYLEGDGVLSPSEDIVDPPPPYSACAPDKRPVALEEPPPPYSDCYVSFSNPKEGNPSVHFYNGQGQSLSVEPERSVNEPKRQKTVDESVGCDNLIVSAVNPGREGGEETVFIDSLPSTSRTAREGTHIVNID